MCLFLMVLVIQSFLTIVLNKFRILPKFTAEIVCSTEFTVATTVNSFIALYTNRVQLQCNKVSTPCWVQHIFNKEKSDENFTNEQRNNSFSHKFRLQRKTICKKTYIFVQQQFWSLYHLLCSSFSIILLLLTLVLFRSPLKNKNQFT